MKLLLVTFFVVCVAVLTYAKSDNGDFFMKAFENNKAGNLTSAFFSYKNCVCNGGDKCCCPSGWKCCNSAGRCCCQG
uniref:Uncharacterized protein n=1 Tax=Panagrolaimus sp. PS1159 TaxID=55785 RepID=A0AC35GY25_9BILA